MIAKFVEGLFVEASSLPGQIHVEEFGAELDELAHGVLFAGSDDVVLRLLLLEHEPLHLDVVAGVAPVAAGVEVAEVERAPGGRP